MVVNKTESIITDVNQTLPDFLPYNETADRINQTDIGNFTLSNFTDFTNLNETDISNSTLAENSSDSF